MPDREDWSYYTLRARQERAIACTCGDNTAALAHFRLSEEYERRAARLAPGPTVPRESAVAATLR
jgi:hypothetical protein